VIRAEDACTAVRSERGACTAESGSATTSLPTAECTAVSHPAMQPHLLGTIALHCARVNSNGSNALSWHHHCHAVHDPP